MIHETHLELLAQADLLLLLARILSPPSSEPFAIPEQDCAALARRAGLTTDRPGAPAALHAALREARGTDLEPWREEHIRLFEAPGCCPVNETAYVRRDKGRILADIAGFYAAFGFALSPRAGEKSDHLVCELEFAGLLLVMQAQALAEGGGEEAEIARDAMAAFARDHLDEWLPLFCERLRGEARLPLFKSAAWLLAESWEAIVASRDLPRADAPEAPQPAEDPGSPYECGLCD